jgi:hypothetical protein
MALDFGQIKAAPQVQLDLKAHKDHKDPLVQLDLKALKDHKDPLVPQVQLDPKDHKDHKGQQLLFLAVFQM